MKLLPTLALVLLASSCVTSKCQVLGAETYPARPLDHPIVVFDAIEDVKAPFVKVGVVQSEGAPAASWADMTEALKRRARAIGADALVLRGEVSGGAEFVAYGNSGPVYGSVRQRKQQSALAIRFIEATDTVPAH